MGELLQVSEPEKAIAYLRDTKTIRDHCLQIRKRLENGQSEYFFYQPEKWTELADLVTQVTLKNYPDLKIPLHSRWRHFDAGQEPRISKFLKKIEKPSKEEIAKIKCELVIISVLLDAGAGDLWRFHEVQTRKYFTRSEGLAVASLSMFERGLFSKDKVPCADAETLFSLKKEDLSTGFQVDKSNPLIGVEGRCELLNNLGRLIENKKEIFPNKRLGDFYTYLLREKNSSIEAKKVLQAVLEVLGDIWASKLFIGKTKLGDVSRHRSVKGQYGTDGLIPFHKLSQWLSYSLIETLQEDGIEIKGLDELTGLAEYRNGGLFLDGGLIVLKDASLYEKKHDPSSELITEWRAITLSMLDELAILVRKNLKVTELSLGQILQGGTWSTGRQLAFAKRQDGGSPLWIQSDGNLF